MKLCSPFKRIVNNLLIKHFHKSDYQEKEPMAILPGITTALKVSIKEKHKLYEKFIFSQTPVNAKLYKTF